MVKQLTVIGVGLIGGSFAKALRQHGVVREVVGYGRNEANLQLGVELGVIDRYALNIADAVKDADVIVLASPLGAMRQVLDDLAPHIKPNAIVTDVGSAKQCVADDARAALATTTHFVPGHPIAGREKSGVTAVDEKLFVEKRVILTPLPENDAESVQLVKKLWQQCGADVVEMAIDHHDKVLAATSHLPHILAYSLVDTLSRLQEQQEIFAYAAGGFRDFTRIASSDPVMWRDICLANKDGILHVLDYFAADLLALREAIEQGDGGEMERIFDHSKQTRDNAVANNRALSGDAGMDVRSAVQDLKAAVRHSVENQTTTLRSKLTRRLAFRSGRKRDK